MQRDRKEITQKTVFKAWNVRESQQYRGDSGEYTWLASIARNLAMDQFRTQARQGSMPEQEGVLPTPLFSCSTVCSVSVLKNI